MPIIVELTLNVRKMDREIGSMWKRDRERGGQEQNQRKKERIFYYFMIESSGLERNDCKEREKEKQRGERTRRTGAGTRISAPCINHRDGRVFMMS